MSSAAPEAQSTSASSMRPGARRRHDVWASCRRVTECFDLGAGIDISATPLPSGKSFSHWSRPPVRRCVPTALLLRRQLLHHRVEIEARGLLPDRELLKARKPLPDHSLRWHDKEHALRHPFAVFE
jgi:hypothetical protein